MILTHGRQGSPDETGAKSHEKTCQEYGANAQNDVLFGAVGLLLRLAQERVLVQVAPELVQRIV